MAQKAEGIIDQPGHLLFGEFLVLPSGRRYSAPVRKTKCYVNSFIPSAVIVSSWLGILMSVDPGTVCHRYVNADVDVDVVKSTYLFPYMNGMGCRNELPSGITKVF